MSVSFTHLAKNELILEVYLHQFIFLTTDNW